MMASLVTSVALFLMLVLAMSSAQKFAARPRTSAATANLLRVDLPYGQLLGLAAAVVEALAAIALLVSVTRPLGASIAAALWAVYTLTLVAAKRRGIAFDCACSFGVQPKPVGTFALLRAFGLFAAAALVAWTPAGAFGAEAVFASFGLLALYLAASELAALPKLQRKVAR